MTTDPNDPGSTATLTFDSDFSSLSLYNGVSGTWSTQPPYVSLTENGSSLSSNGEQEWYINNNYAPTDSITPWTVNNGILTLTAAPAPASIQPLINGYQYTSGELNTYHSFSQTYGFFEMRAELPAGQGLWPAFWLLPENGSWPPELDIMEVLGNNAMQLYTTVHSGSTNVANGNMATVANMSTSFNNYAVNWTATTITWYFNGQVVYQTPTPSDMNQPMYMIVNLAVGGTWPGDVNSTTQLPAQMEVAYVSAYSSDPDPIATPTTFTANGTAGQVLLGAPGNDIFYAGTNSVIMTGYGETNTYIYTALPTSAGQITDFSPANDTINLSGLLQSLGYNGTAPFTDGTLSLVSDGNNGTYVEYKATNSSAPKIIVDLDNVSPSAINIIQDFITSSGGSSSGGGGGTVSGTGTSTTTPGGSTDTTPGQTLTANETAGQALTAATPNDTFYAGQNSVVMTEDGGSNTFVYTALPYNAGQIANFNPTSDTINLTGLLQSVGYTGTAPFSDGTFTLTSDGHGGTDLVYNPPGAGSNGIWPVTVVDLDNVSLSAVNISQDFVTSSGGSSSGGGGGTVSGTGTSTTTPGGSTDTTPGQTLTANETAGQALTAATPNDTFYAGQNSVVMTEDGGSNTFVYTALPYNAGQIANFNPTSDTINLTKLLQSVGYTGTAPFSDGTFTLTSDGHSGTDLVYNPPGAGSNGIWPVTVVDLDNVSLSAVNISQDFVTSSGGSSSGGGGGTVSGTGTSTTTPGGSTATGETLTANDTAGQVLTGGAGSTFYAGHNSVVMTGGGANDTFVFQDLPWNAGQVTNFNPASDKLDLTALFTAAGYTGSNPVQDGYISFASDGAGDTKVYFDPQGPATAIPTLITTLDNVAPSSVSLSDVLWGETVPTNSSSTATPGLTLTANNTPGQVLTGGAGNDIFYAGLNSVIMTGGGGSDTFVFQSLPWNASQITNFNPATDVLDLRGVFTSIGYTGSNPVTDGYLSFVSDGAGDTKVYVDAHNPANPWPTLITTLAHVAPTSLTASDWLFH